MQLENKRNAIHSHALSRHRENRVVFLVPVFIVLATDDIPVQPALREFVALLVTGSDNEDRVLLNLAINLLSEEHYSRSKEG